MNIITKTLIPNKEWIVESDNQKLGSILKKKKGYDFLKKGQKFEFKNLNEIKRELGISFFDQPEKEKTISNDQNVIYDFPCSSKPFNSMYNLRKKLPLYSKSNKSKSQYCAGYYLVKFRKGWVKGFCPKLITIERYPYYGPFKTEEEMKNFLSKLNKK